jgi:hypothetical protein
MSNPRVHMLDAAEPLFAFRDLVCRCETILHNAEVKLMGSADMREHMIAPFGICMACYRAEPERAGDQRSYVYFLVEAQEERNVVA